jgi:hypothetical protein
VISNINIVKKNPICAEFLYCNLCLSVMFALCILHYLKKFIKFQKISKLQYLKKKKFNSKFQKFQKISKFHKIKKIKKMIKYSSKMRLPFIDSDLLF